MADIRWECIIIVTRCTDMRPGEVIHLRWMDDVLPLPDGRGYEIRLEGGRGKDDRCTCRQCAVEAGWAPKNGPRRYVLDREADEVGWITPACDALDRWVTVLQPKRGDFVFPNVNQPGTTMSNNQLNKELHDLAARAGVVTGMNKRGSRTFHSFRHTYACELIELGVSHPHAAYWIGDTLEEFQKTYGKPTPERMTRAIFSRAGRTPSGAERAPGRAA